jgi:hypothetical protein
VTSEVAKQISEPEFRSRTLDVAREGWLRETARGDEPVEMPLPSDPHVLPRHDLGAPQTSNHDACATRGLFRGALGSRLRGRQPRSGRDDDFAG